MSVDTNHTSWIGKVHRTHAEQTQTIRYSLLWTTLAHTQCHQSKPLVHCTQFLALLWVRSFKMHSVCCSLLPVLVTYFTMHCINLCTKLTIYSIVSFLYNILFYHHPLFLWLFCWVSPTITLSDTDSIAATHNRYVWWNPLYICIIWDLIIAS